MKKFLKLFTVALCLVSMLFAAVACEPGGQLDERTTQELVDNISSPEAISQAEGFSFDVKIKDDSESHVSGILQMGANNLLSGDIVYAASDEVSAMAIRNSQFYTLDLDSKVSEGDLLQAVKSYVEQNVGKFEMIDPEEIADLIGGIGSLPGGMPGVGFPDGDLPIEDLPEGLVEAVTNLGKKALTFVFNKSQKTADGYMLYCDLYQIFEDVWSKVYAVAEKVDANKQITVSELWKSEELGKIINPTLGNFTGKQFEEILNMALNQIGMEELPFEIPAAKDDENAVAYVGRILETVKVPNSPITVGSLRIADLLLMTGVQDVDLTDELDKVKPTIAEPVKKVSDGLKMELHFNSEKKLSGFVFALKMEQEDAQPIDISVNVSLLVNAPVLWNLTGLE